MMPLSFTDTKTFAEFSTFGIGGKISHFADVTTIDQMREGILFAEEEELPLFILGRGSNCLFDDLDFNGVVLHNKLDFCTWHEDSLSVHVGAGYSFALLGVQSARRGWAGLEFASGIPASVGGAIFMNAGAGGSETCGALSKVLYMNLDGEIEEYSKEDLRFGYRFSPFHKKKGAIIAATFSFTKHATAREKQIRMVEYRIKTQPLKEKSIGCIFRNPTTTNVSASFLIEQSGLKGFAIRGAKVSEQHANFIINHAGASAADVRELMEHVQAHVLHKTGFELHPEIRQIHG